MTAPLDYSVPLPRALARLAWTLTKWAALLGGLLALAGLYVALLTLLLATMLFLFAVSIVVAVVVFL